jgi:hypothetical protein
MKNLYVWGNHHVGSANFQNQLDWRITECTSFPRPTFHQIDTLNRKSISQLRFNLDFQPSVIVIITGDDNLKKDQPVFEIVDNFKRLYQALADFSNLRILTCSLIPEKQANVHRQHQLKYANNELRKLHSKPKKTQLQSRPDFISLDGVFDSLDFTSSNDLNERGSEKLAVTIFKYLCCTVDDKAKTN